MKIKYINHATEGDNPFKCISCSDFYYHAQSHYNLCDTCHTESNKNKIDILEVELDKKIEVAYQKFLMEKQQ